MTDEEKREVQTMIREAVLNERDRLGGILRRARIVKDYDSYGPSKPNFEMTMVSIAEEIEKPTDEED